MIKSNSRVPQDPEQRSRWLQDVRTDIETMQRIILLLQKEIETLKKEIKRAT